MPLRDQAILETGVGLDKLEQLWSLLQEPVHGPSSASKSSNIFNSDNRTTTDDSSAAKVERKRKRMISNRESARRSRWRKKKHFEDLIDEMHRLCVANHKLGEKLGLVVYRCDEMHRENQWLHSERASLYAMLLNLHRISMDARSRHQIIYPD
ncbi:hypothetical protein MLD38_024710 [Melastoma candidum]|uniref:Uncharacterized protein n=1 Tax=Melastoma candidum TaxID=119954 RepID=A0ACB9NU40_9MYRT|nr:hypothetical protein MLD38_024710 [Melastoma candidum]